MKNSLIYTLVALLLISFSGSSFASMAIYFQNDKKSELTIGPNAFITSGPGKFPACNSLRGGDFHYGPQKNNNIIVKLVAGGGNVDKPVDLTHSDGKACGNIKLDPQCMISIAYTTEYGHGCKNVNYSVSGCSNNVGVSEFRGECSLLITIGFSGKAN